MRARAKGGRVVRTWAAAAVAALLLAAGSCGAGVGSGQPCEESFDCPPGEACVLTSCGASSATCEILCETDDDCIGGIDSSPSGAACLAPEIAACPGDAPAEQQPGDRYCVD